MKMRLSVNHLAVIVILAMSHVQTLKTVWKTKETQANIGVSLRMGKIVRQEATVLRVTVMRIPIRGAGMTVVVLVRTLFPVLDKMKPVFMAPVLLWRTAMLMTRAKVAGIV
jgi:hypothetical protein